MRSKRPPLTIKQILAWADAHHARTGKWPHMDSGHVRDNLNKKWQNIGQALRRGLRGLEGGSSLAKLLAKERGVRNVRDLPPLSEAQILAWADAHHAAGEMSDRSRLRIMRRVDRQHVKGGALALSQGLPHPHPRAVGSMFRKRSAGATAPLRPSTGLTDRRQCKAPWAFGLPATGAIHFPQSGSSRSIVRLTVH